MTIEATSGTHGAVARTKEFTERILIPFRPSELDEIDLARGDTPRATFIRETTLAVIRLGAPKPRKASKD